MPQPAVAQVVVVPRIYVRDVGVVGSNPVTPTVAAVRTPHTFEIAHVVVRDVEEHFDVPERTSDVRVAAIHSIDIIVECFGGTTAYPVIETALTDGKFVVAANKALVAGRWAKLSPYVHAMDRQLWYSAAVGGAVPALETLQALKDSKKSIVEIRGIINGTSGVVLDARAEGKSLREAIALAKEQGFSEADPTRDLSGQDSADKLALMAEAAFGEWLSPESIAIQGIDSIAGDPKGYKLVARARKTSEGIVASVAPDVPPPTSFFREAKGAENRIEIELKSGEVIRLNGQGAGRWPTAVSVMGDLHEVARLVESCGRVEVNKSASTPMPSSMDLAPHLGLSERDVHTVRRPVES
jgi:homoserine dehydrogenase